MKKTIKFQSELTKEEEKEILIARKEYQEGRFIRINTKDKDAIRNYLDSLTSSKQS